MLTESDYQPCTVEIPSTAARLRGYREALATAGRPPDERLIAFGGTGREDAIRAMRRLFAAPDPPSALFTISNFMTSGAVHALRDLPCVSPITWRSSASTISS